jgi:hypothetical protein
MKHLKLGEPPNPCLPIQQTVSLNAERNRLYWAAAFGMKKLTLCTRGLLAQNDKQEYYHFAGQDMAWFKNNSKLLRSTWISYVSVHNLPLITMNKFLKTHISTDKSLSRTYKLLSCSVCVFFVMHCISFVWAVIIKHISILSFPKAVGNNNYRAGNLTPALNVFVCIK